MKKYWSVIAISVMIVASIGTFYMQSIWAENEKPVFMIETINGNEQEIEPLLLGGYYNDGLNYLDYTGVDFEISLEGIKYFGEQSFFERINENYGGIGSERIKQFQKDHRHFMRGKYYSINSYFENEEYLAYADVSYKNPYEVSSELQFSIAVLDKQKNKTTSFEHLVPNSGDFWYLDPVKVQVIDDQLKVITQNDMREDDSRKIHQYTFDLTKKKLLSEEVILSIENKENEYIEMEQLNVDDPTKESEYVAFVKRSMEPNEEGYLESVTGEDLVVYDLTANTSEIINLENLAEHGYPEYLDGQHIYLTNTDDNGVLNVSVYDIKSEQIIDHIEGPALDNEIAKTTAFNDGKLFIVDSYIDYETPAYITVIELQNGETVFEGEIVREDQKGAIEKASLNIYNVFFK